MCIYIQIQRGGWLVGSVIYGFQGGFSAKHPSSLEKKKNQTTVNKLLCTPLIKYKKCVPRKNKTIFLYHLS